MKSKYLEKRRPICSLEIVQFKSSEHYEQRNSQKLLGPKRKWLNCKIGIKKMKVKIPVKDCKDIPKMIEKCRKTIKIEREKKEKNVCSYHQQEICPKKMVP